MSTRPRGKPRKSVKGKRVAKRSVVGVAEQQPAGASVSPASPEFLIDEGLTPAQLVFVEELCADPTKPAVHAARIAYPEQVYEAQRSTASENMTKPHIKAAIDRRLRPLMVKSRTSRERVLQVMGDFLNADKRAIVGPDGATLPFHKWPPELARMCTGFDQEEIRVGEVVVGRVVKPRFVDPLAVVQVVARVNKMLVDRVEHEAGESLEALLTKVHSKAVA